MAGTANFVEAQAANGLDRWADHFTHLTVAAPVIPDSQLPNLSGFVWRELDSLEHRACISAQPLPWAYTPRPFFPHLGPTRRLLAQSISQHQHLQFAIGGLIGDWAAVAGLEAIRQRRPYAIHTDRVDATLAEQPVRRLHDPPPCLGLLLRARSHRVPYLIMTPYV